MAGPFDALGTALGGDSEESYQQGRALGAKTEEALANARRRVTENDAVARAQSDLEANGVEPNQAKLMAGSLAAGKNYEDPIKGMLAGQEFGNRADIANPDIPLEVAQRRAMAIQGTPTDRYQKIGGGADDRFDAAGIQPLGDAAGSEGGGSSAGIQALRAFGFLTPDGRVAPGREADAFDLYRDTVKNVEAGGVTKQTTNNPFRRGEVRTPVALPEVAANAGQIATSKELGGATGKNAASLPTTLNTIDTFNKDIDQLVASPGFDTIYGARVGTAPGQAAATFVSQDAADAAGLRNKINAESFRASISSMRGLGQLSNAEGEKVQAALTTLSNPKLSPEAARAAAQQLKQHLAELRRVAQIEAGQGGAQAPIAPTAGGAMSLEDYLKSKGF
jgi:hypothetical protein